MSRRVTGKIIRSKNINTTNFNDSNYASIANCSNRAFQIDPHDGEIIKDFLQDQLMPHFDGVQYEETYNGYNVPLLAQQLYAHVVDNLTFLESSIRPSNCKIGVYGRQGKTTYTLPGFLSVAFNFNCGDVFYYQGAGGGTKRQWIGDCEWAFLINYYRLQLSEMPVDIKTGGTKNTYQEAGTDKRRTKIKGNNYLRFTVIFEIFINPDMESDMISDILGNLIGSKHNPKFNMGNFAKMVEEGNKKKKRKRKKRKNNTAPVPITDDVENNITSSQDIIQTVGEDIQTVGDGTSSQGEDNNYTYGVENIILNCDIKTDGINIQGQNIGDDILFVGSKREE